MTTLYFDYKDDSHPIKVYEIEENGNKFFEVEFVENAHNIHEIISFKDSVKFDDKGYGPKAKSMAGINVLLSMWKSIEKHFQLISN